MTRWQEGKSGVLVWAIGLAYFSLTVWMHIWALEAGLPLPGEPKKPHHQVCTWIGTSGEAAHIAWTPLALPRPAVFRTPSVSHSLPTLSATPSALEARAPPSSSVASS